MVFPACWNAYSRSAFFFFDETPQVCCPLTIPLTHPGFYSWSNVNKIHYIYVHTKDVRIFQILVKSEFKNLKIVRFLMERDSSSVLCTWNHFCMRSRYCLSMLCKISWIFFADHLIHVALLVLFICTVYLVWMYAYSYFSNYWRCKKIIWFGGMNLLYYLLYVLILLESLVNYLFSTYCFEYWPDIKIICSLKYILRSIE